MSTPLFAAFPEIADAIPWTPLGRFPTRVQRLERLGADTGARELWIKREDESGEVYGGNKVRKLEHLLADARARGSRRLYTLGGLGSNFALATAIYGRAAGFEVHAQAIPQPMDEHARANLRAVLATGTTVELARRRAEAPLRLLLSYAKHRVAPNGGPPYYNMLGGSSAMGTLGYVGAAFELRDQVARGELPEPEVIVVALGSGGTVAGLTLGVRLAGLKSKVIGVRVVERSLVNATSAALLATRTAQLLRRAGARIPRVLMRPADIHVIHDFFGTGYAHPSPAGKDAVQRMRELEGIELETTYTGKALAGLLDLIRREQLYRRPLLFWNTVSSVDLSSLLARAPKREEVTAELRRFYD
jgi:D-cysteine desulfhydrase